MDGMGASAPSSLGGGMSDYAIKIEVIKGGFGVYVCDPKIEKANMEPKTAWKDPWVEYHFETADAVCKFISEVLPDLKPEDSSSSFDAAFKRAVAEDESNEGE